MGLRLLQQCDRLRGKLDEAAFARFEAIEVAREAATLVMIGAVGWLAGRTRLERLAWAAVVFGADSGLMALLAALAGGTLAATSHAAKATARAAINTSPEPFSNVGASLVEDSMVPLGLWLAIAHPLVFVVVLLLVLVASVWLIRLCWRFLTQLFARVARIFSGKPDTGPPPAFTFKSPFSKND